MRPGRVPQGKIGLYVGLLCSIFAQACAQAGPGAPANSEAPIGPAASLPPPLDPAVLIAREFESAVAEDTNAALILFIARHPDEPLTDEARRLLMARTEPDPAPADNPDGEIIFAFDAARLAGTRGALLDFAARYPAHPLAREARLRAEALAPN